MLNKYVLRFSALATLLATIGSATLPFSILYVVLNHSWNHLKMFALIIVAVILVIIGCLLHHYTTYFPTEDVVYGYNPDKSSWKHAPYDISYVAMTFKNWKDIYTINPSIWNLTHYFPWETTVLPDNSRAITGEGIGVQFKLMDFYRYKYFAKHINTYNEIIKRQKENNELMTTLLVKAQADINKIREQSNKEMKHSVNNILEIHTRVQEEA